MIRIIIVVCIACILLVTGCASWTIFTEVSVENTTEENIPIIHETSYENNETRMPELGF